MAPISVTQQARLLVGLAIVGAIPVTVGAILWLVGTVMGSAYHGDWSGTAGLGGALILAGLICGLVLFLVAAAGERWTPPESWGPSRNGPHQLTPLASPEQQAFLADLQPPEPLPAEPAKPAVHSGGQLPFFPADPPSQPFPAVPAPEQAPSAAAQGYPPPVAQQWPDPEPPLPPYPAFRNG